MAFLHHHREVIVAFDFFTVPTLTFRLLYCFFVIEHGRRRIPHFNITRHPTSDWVVQLHEAFAEAGPYCYVLLDRDSTFDADVIAFLKATGLEPKRTTIQSAALGTLRRIGLEQVLARSRSPERDLVAAMIVARILMPGSKLATARCLSEQTMTSSLNALLGLDALDEDRLYEATDWLLARQSRIEDKLAQRHLQEGSLVLYDLTSTYFEGRRCPLARYGHSRDERPGNLQIAFGLLTNHAGCPVVVEVFEGNTGDPKTVATQIRKLRQRFGLKQVVLVGDRGIGWVTALRALAIQRLASDGNLQLSLFDQQDLAGIQHPTYPGERSLAATPCWPTLTRNRIRLGEQSFEMLATPTLVQQRALQLLQVRP